MQKALTEMNVQLATVLSDLSGTTGMSILRAIVRGERDPSSWPASVIRMSRPARRPSRRVCRHVAAGTIGHPEAAIRDWDHIQQQIVACDRDLQRMMQGLPDAEQGPTPRRLPAQPTAQRRKKRNGKASRNEPKFDLESELRRVTGVDLTRIDGVKVNTIQTVITKRDWI